MERCSTPNGCTSTAWSPRSAHSATPITSRRCARPWWACPGRIARRYCRRYGEDFPLAEINKAFLARRDEMLEAGLPLKCGAVALLDALRENDCPMAIVTSSSRRTAEAHLTLAGIRNRFGTILTRDDVTRGKPSPDLYLLAASRLALPPERCVAVEDSNHGVTSAHAAGTITIMVPDMVPPTDESRARCAAVVADLNAVRTMLHRRGNFTRRS